jgi:hypothetical protein
MNAGAPSLLMLVPAINNTGAPAFYEYNLFIVEPCDLQAVSILECWCPLLINAGAPAFTSHEGMLVRRPL